MIKLVDVSTEMQVGEINLNAAAAPRQGEHVKTPEGFYLVTNRTYDVSELGNLNQVTLHVSKLVD